MYGFKILKNNPLIFFGFFGFFLFFRVYEEFLSEQFLVTDLSVFWKVAQLCRVVHSVHVESMATEQDKVE